VLNPRVASLRLQQRIIRHIGSFFGAFWRRRKPAFERVMRGLDSRIQATKSGQLGDAECRGRAQPDFNASSQTIHSTTHELPFSAKRI
jgi:hypothetical protein